MGFEFVPERDLLYLAFIFFGAALGFILNHWRRRITKRRRDLSLTFAFLLLSGAVVSFAIMLIFTGGRLPGN